ncbi:DUF4138 domain-containing protein [Cellulophaga sp. Z1A5H]|uniref:DUF4138 domain-containing protein n=1 Tax=Cellulophaga sp. Z1A5H TaxID=2687291 RepID=UPI0013FD8C89|nr:DUF4138 domain-containing protein [Cellulophaga sp. Z1A5H]
MIATYLKYILFFLLLSNQMGYAHSGEPISIAINEANIITFIFPDQILNVTEPSSDFMFSYEEQSNLGVLKAKKTKQLSNLTVTTKDGYIYSFVLVPTKDVTNFVFVMTTSNAIGRINVGQNGATTPVPSSETPPEVASNATITEGSATSTSESVSDPKPAVVTSTATTPQPVNQFITGTNPKGEAANVKSEEGNTLPITAPTKSIHEIDLYTSEPQTYYNIFCENIHIEKPTIKNVSRKVGVLEIRLNDITLDKNEMYFSLQILNESGKAYTVKDMEFFVMSKGSKKQFKIEPLYVYNFRNDLGVNSEVNAVYVLKNIRLSEKQQMFIILEGLDHDRYMMLAPPNEVVNR